MEPIVLEFCETMPARTAKAYLRDLTLFVQHCDAMGLAVADAQRYHVISFEQTRRRRGDAPSTLRRRMSALRSFYAHLSHSGVRRDNPTNGLEPIQTPLSGGSMIDIGDLTRCLAEASRQPDDSRGTVLAVVLLVAYRLRVDQLVQLTDADITRSRSRWTLRVDDEVVDVPHAFRALIPRTARHGQRYLLSGASAPVTRQTIGRWIRRLGDQAEITPRSVTPRVLQRSAIGIALAVGADPQIVTRRNWMTIPVADHPSILVADHLEPQFTAWT